MNYIEYSNQVYSTMAILESKGFKINHWTRECSGTVNGKWAMVTFYPDDEKFILFIKEDERGRYISVAELVGILNSMN